MNEKIQFARDDFEKFVASFRRIVPRVEMLDRFLSAHPYLEGFRTELLDDFRPYRLVHPASEKLNILLNTKDK
jgi:hypothetical protein